MDRVDREPIGKLVGLKTQTAQLVRDGPDAVGLLVANVGHVADACRPVRERGDGSQRLGRIADFVHVDVDAAERSAPHGDRRLAPLDVAAHLLQKRNEANVPLERVLSEPLDRHFAPRDGGGGEEITGGRRVRLNVVNAGLVALGTMW